MRWFVGQSEPSRCIRSLFGPGLLDGLERGHLCHRFVFAWAEPHWGKLFRATAHAILDPPAVPIRTLQGDVGLPACAISVKDRDP